jgi:hypothetical protein
MLLNRVQDALRRRDQAVAADSSCATRPRAAGLAPAADASSLTERVRAPERPGRTAHMPDITVFPHGGRWAVGEQGTESASKEFDSREAAEMAARQLAAGGSVRVLESDPTDLEPDASDPDGRDEPAGDPAQPAEVPESARATQPGL